MTNLYQTILDPDIGIVIKIKSAIPRCKSTALVTRHSDAVKLKPPFSESSSVALQ